MRAKRTKCSTKRTPWTGTRRMSMPAAPSLRGRLRSSSAADMPFRVVSAGNTVSTRAWMPGGSRRPRDAFHFPAPARGTRLVSASRRRARAGALARMTVALSSSLAPQAEQRHLAPGPSARCARSCNLMIRSTAPVGSWRRDCRRVRRPANAERPALVEERLIAEHDRSAVPGRRSNLGDVRGPLLHPARAGRG